MERPYTHVATSSLGHSCADQAYPSHPGNHDYSVSCLREFWTVPVKSHLRDFSHVGALGTPCLVTRGLTHFDLGIRVALRDVLSVETC